MSRKLMTPIQIRHALEQAGYTQVDVAQECGVTQPSVNLVINNRGTSHRIRCHIASLIGRQVDEIWEIKDDPTKTGRPLSRLRHQVV
jgi:predicted XRE-type DNA-binding protein